MRTASMRSAWLRILVGTIFAASLLGAASSGLAAGPERRPLVMEGKQTLYQRVLTRPGAQLESSPRPASGKEQAAFSQFYVYERKQVDGQEWLLVGGATRGVTDGWIDARMTLPWKQQMALAFTNPANRERALLFATQKDLTNVLKAKNSAEAARTIRDAVVAGKPDDRVLSMEPAEHIDIARRFYLLPILQAEEVVTPAGNVRVLEVASLSARSGEAPPGVASPAPKSETPSVLRTFTATVVFVIDSTISMGPYIDRTREAVRRIYDQIEKAGLSAQVKFGLVAYRSSVKAVPRLEYVSRLFVDPVEVKGGDDFLRRVADLRPAPVSTPVFDEDAFAGVMNAMEIVDWSKFGGRYVVLITDAGAIKGSSELSSTGLDAEQVRLEAEQSGVALYALHLKTPEGKKFHANAETQYRALTLNKVIGKSLYYDVDAGAVDQFGRIVDTLADAIVSQVQAASLGEMVPGSARTATPDKSASGKPADASAAVAQDARLVGHAMQLAFLGRVQGTAAPDVFRAWVCDRDFARPGSGDAPLETTEVRVLLTKNQLSSLRDVVRAILDAGDQAQHDVGTADFFDLLRSSAAQLARDPARLNDSKARKLGEMGLLGEYLDDLPYQSGVMSLTSDAWEAWSLDQQEEFLDGLRRKLRHYQIYHDDVDRWVALSATADPGEHVYPVPLEALP